MNGVEKRIYAKVAAMEIILNPYVIALFCTHLVLYTAWKLPAWLENQKRVDSEQIPVYATGDIVDIPAFSFITIAFASGLPGYTGNEALWSLLVALVLTGVLHRYWVYAAKRNSRPQSIYLADGSTTVAGKLHVLYVFYVWFIVIMLLISLSTLASLQLWLLGSGAALYLLAVVVDRIRGVI